MVLNGTSAERLVQLRPSLSRVLKMSLYHECTGIPRGSLEAHPLNYEQFYFGVKKKEKKSSEHPCAKSVRASQTNRVHSRSLLHLNS